MIHPALLCGGSGTRLWPLSHKSYPRQFAPLLGEETLFQASARRLSGPGFAAPLVLTGAAQSLQSHHHRSEHWIVVQGTARVTVDGAVRLLSGNQSVYIPLGAVHRMENPGKVDIIRDEDVYVRG